MSTHYRIIATLRLARAQHPSKAQNPNHFLFLLHMYLFSSTNCTLFVNRHTTIAVSSKVIMLNFGKNRKKKILMLNSVYVQYFGFSMPQTHGLLPPQPTASIRRCNWLSFQWSFGSGCIWFFFLWTSQAKIDLSETWSRLSRSVFFEPVSRGAGGWKGLDFVGLTCISYIYIHWLEV